MMESTIKINRMLTDNFKVLICFFVLTFLLLVILFYFSYQIYLIVCTYYENLKSKVNQLAVDSNIPTDRKNDNENYDTNSKVNSSKIDASQFIDPKKRQFLDSIESKSSEYNKEKQDWIIKNLGKKTDYDLINDDILYRKHDNY